MKRYSYLLVLAPLLVASCETRDLDNFSGALNRDAGQRRMTWNHCGCSDYGWNTPKPALGRCAGDVVEHCSGVTNTVWVATEACKAGQRCIHGECHPKVPGCPDRAEKPRVEFDLGTEYQRVSSCIEGGKLGLKVTFQGVPLTEGRSLRFVGLSGCVDPASALAKAGVDLDKVFGVDVDGQVSARTMTVSPRTVHPGSRGVWIQERTRIDRVSRLWRGEKLVGLAILTDYHVSQPSLSSGCPPSSYSDRDMGLPALYDDKPCLLSEDGCDRCSK